MNPETQLCDGCLRTLGEIATWSQLSAAQQRQLCATLRQRRALQERRAPSTGASPQ
ncbi:DUF1289 domain-containing protein [Burkholderia sp. L27(2015)]|uniref:DUF1289 domain-containing protein n=1 Tax=Burkholderia sp. L27(2015) TaxID=1641858 RepID=UPI0020B166BC|nr:DUF1289 domain-containing protein [Burkholderia sp. L27(2015)]